MAKVEVGKHVFSNTGKEGIIVRIITKSTGYVEVDYHGALKKEMAFNLSDAAGQPLKSKPSPGLSRKARDAESIAQFAQKSNLEKIKTYILKINNLIPGDRKSASYQIISELLANIYHVAKRNENVLVVDIINNVEKYMKCSEKQAWVIANFADLQNFKYEENI